MSDSPSGLNLAVQSCANRCDESEREVPPDELATTVNVDADGFVPKQGPDGAALRPDISNMDSHHKVPNWRVFCERSASSAAVRSSAFTHPWSEVPVPQGALQ